MTDNEQEHVWMTIALIPKLHSEQ